MVLWSSINIAVRLRFDSAVLESAPIPGSFDETSSNGHDDKTIDPNHARHQILAEILHRSGNFPLDVTISFPKVYLVPTAWKRFFSLLSTSSHRWTALDLEAPSALWERFVGATSLPASCPLLLDLRATILDSSSIMARIARACRNVATMMIDQFGDVVDTPEDPVPTLSLKRLESDCPHILKVTTAPALNYLSLRRSRCLERESGVESSKAFIIPFLIRSRCSKLTDVELLLWNHFEDAVNILFHMPTLRSLSINFSLEESFFIMMKSSSSFLPQLQKLKFGECCCYAMWDSDINLDMVESRMVAGALQSVDIGPIFAERGSATQLRLDALNAMPNVRIKFSDESNALFRHRWMLRW
ncbi:hypothetical protein F5146DRAFT_147753 [Armillaria mellea]|nr:hypothetical protein F5146DRAFT_147753 [Armillaria mellea]